MTNKWNCFVVMGLSSYALTLGLVVPAWAQESTSIRVLSYNIHGLPEVLVPDQGQYARIGDLLAERRRHGTAPQIVAIQEGWDFSGTAGTLITHAGYPYVEHGLGVSFGHLLTSGIHILSEYPVEAVDQMSYSECNSWDCQATKGALHVRIRVPGVPIPVDIYTTHLNSDPESDPSATVPDCRAVRIKQISDLAKFIEQTSNPGSVIFAPGDYNSFPGSDELLWFYGLSMLENTLNQCARPGSGCTGQFGSELKDAIDHQYYRSGSNHGRRVQVKPVAYERNFAEIFKGEPLSDHLGLEVEYQLNW